MNNMKKCVVALALSSLFLGGVISAQEATPTSVVIQSNNLDQLQMLVNIEGSGTTVEEVTFAPNSQILAIASRDSLVLWDLQAQEARWRIPLSLATHVSFSRDGTSLLAAAYPSLYLWNDLEDSQSWQELKNKEGQWIGGVGDIQFSEDSSEVVAILVQSRGIFRWRSDTGELLFEQYSPYIDEDTAVQSSILSSDGQIGVFVVHPQKLEFVDTTQGNLLNSPSLTSLFGDDLGITLLTFSRDNQHLLVNIQSPSNSLNSLLTFLSIEGEIVSQVEVDYEAIWIAGTFSPDGTLLTLVNGIDASIHFFNASTLEEIISVDAEQNSVKGLTFSPDGTLLASGGSDGTVRLWGVAGEG